MLTDALVVIDVMAATGLVVLILLHSGRGGGLSDMFGASSGSSTVAERNLDRITVVFVLVFAFVTVALSLRWTG